jgi:hypothetical protein
VVYVASFAEHLSANMILYILSAIKTIALCTSFIVVALTDFMAFIALTILVKTKTRNTFDFKSCIEWAFPILNTSTIETFGLK